MNRDEAKFILRAYHLGGQDADDPQFRDALDLVRRDPALAEWFAQEQVLDGRLSEKFRAYPLPPDLKGQLLAARKVIPHRVWWRRPAWIAAAACLVLAAALALLLFRPADKPPFAEFRSYVADTTAKLDHLDLMSRDLTELRSWLQKRGAPDDFVLPTSLNGRPTIGCRVFDWKGNRVSLVCFHVSSGREVHLFVIDRAALRNVPIDSAPQFASSRGGISTAAWSSHQRVYVLASDIPEPELKQLL